MATSKTTKFEWQLLLRALASDALEVYNVLSFESEEEKQVSDEQGIRANGEALYRSNQCHINRKKRKQRVNLHKKQSRETKYHLKIKIIRKCKGFGSFLLPQMLCKMLYKK